jgi:hypothetical protein
LNFDIFCKNKTQFPARVILCRFLKTIANSKQNRTTQKFCVASSYVNLFKGKISNFEFGNFDLDRVMGLG